MDPESLIGQVLAGCTIKALLNQGKRSAVYRAVDGDLQPCAVKVLHSHDAKTVERFSREIKALTELDHPRIASVRSSGQEGEHQFIVMELVEGETLEALVERDGKLPWQQAVELVAGASDALAHAHSRNLIHRDVAPAHLMLDDDGAVKVIGFGLVKEVDHSGSIVVQGAEHPHFMSPEQAGGKPADARADIYSLGATLYFAITGTRPFGDSSTLQDIVAKTFFQAPESAQSLVPDLPTSVNEIIRRCIKKKKNARYQSATELANVLRAQL